MITSGKVTLTAKIIKDIFKEIGLEGKWCYNSSSIGCKASKEEMQKGLLDILTGAYTPSVVIRGDIFEKLVKEKMDGVQGPHQRRQRARVVQKVLDRMHAETTPWAGVVALVVQRMRDAI